MSLAPPNTCTSISAQPFCSVPYSLHSICQENVKQDKTGMVSLCKMAPKDILVMEMKRLKEMLDPSCGTQGAGSHSGTTQQYSEYYQNSSAGLGEFTAWAARQNSPRSFKPGPNPCPPRGSDFTVLSPCPCVSGFSRLPQRIPVSSR